MSTKGRQRQRWLDSPECARVALLCDAAAAEIGRAYRAADAAIAAGDPVAEEAAHVEALAAIAASRDPLVAYEAARLAWIAEHEEET